MRTIPPMKLPSLIRRMVFMKTDSKGKQKVVKAFLYFGKEWFNIGARANQMTHSPDCAAYLLI
jgi:hypothetical protein